MNTIEKIVIRNYPSTISLLPSGILALILAINVQIFGFNSPISKLSGLILLTFFAWNLLVASYTFTEGRTFGFIALIVLAIVVYLLLGAYGYIPKGTVSLFLSQLDIRLTRDAYLTFAFAIFFLCFIAWLIARFDYWIVERNQVLHRTGLIGKYERYSTFALKYTVEVNDVFKYIFFKAGKLTLMFLQERKAYALNFVPRIKRTMDRLNRLMAELEIEEEYK